MYAPERGFLWGSKCLQLHLSPWANGMGRWTNAITLTDWRRCGSVVFGRKQTPNISGELWSQGSGAGKHSGYAAPPQSCHSTERELLVCSQNGTLLCQPKGACPPACKASFWWCAGCLFCSLSALFISGKSWLWKCEVVESQNFISQTV